MAMPGSFRLVWKKRLQLQPDLQFTRDITGLLFFGREMNLSGIKLALLMLTKIFLMPLEGPMQAGTACRDQAMMPAKLDHIARDLPG